MAHEQDIRQSFGSARVIADIEFPSIQTTIRKDDFVGVVTPWSEAVKAGWALVYWKGQDGFGMPLEVATSYLSLEGDGYDVLLARISVDGCGELEAPSASDIASHAQMQARMVRDAARLERRNARKGR